MERRLSEAAMKGSVDSLLEILQEEPLILDRTIVSCISETPLHTAAMLGHLHFVKELLTLKPELAGELDFHGAAPLHLAAAKGHAEVVRQLLVADPEICTVRNEDGRTPLHVAAFKGRAVVLSELARVKPEATRVVTDRGETVLHLCVMQNRLEALRALVEAMGGDDDEIVNWKDSDGNTVLHIAVAKKQIETIKFLLAKFGMEVNALNANGFTAFDILMQSPRDLRDMDIEDYLLGAGALSSKDLNMILPDGGVPVKSPITKGLASPEIKALASSKSIGKIPAVKHKNTDWLGRKRSALMVVASLLATVAFQAGINPPGGVWQDDLTVDSEGNPVANPHKVGTAVMPYSQRVEYGVYMIFNTLVFLASLSIILLLVSGLPLKRRRWMWIQMIIMWIAISAQVVTYFLSLRYMSPTNVYGYLRDVTEISVLTWFSLMCVVFIGNSIRVNRWFRSKRRDHKEKEKLTSAQIAENQEEI